MSMGIQISAIVEGHGETDALRIVCRRIGSELLGGVYIDLGHIRRRPQGTLLTEAGLREAVEMSRSRMANSRLEGFTQLLLILIDSEGQPPCRLAPKLHSWAKAACSDIDIACVLPHPMFETWFAAGAGSLAGYNDLPADLKPPPEPEANSVGKGWIMKQLKRKYAERIDQPRFASKFDLAECRANSRSFDKLCRELEARRSPPRAADG